MRISYNFKEKLIKERSLIKKHQEYAILCDCKETVINIHDEVIIFIDSILNLIQRIDLSRNYINLLENDFSNLVSLFTFRSNPNSDFISESIKQRIKEEIEKQESEINRLKQIAEFNYNFFINIDFLNSNIVAIGSNGSGKSSLSNKFKDLMQNNGIVISAQKILLIPKFHNLQNPEITNQKFEQTKTYDKTFKNENSYSSLKDEFSIVLQNLLSENNSKSNEFRIRAIKESNSGLPISIPEKTRLDRTFEIWNSLIEHREISCKDGMNISITSKDKYEYLPMMLSDGEKVILFLVAQVLQTPDSGFIIIDEPEMYLHKSILKKLWNILEKERQDCIFIYLTHDLDFASSRTTAKKIWIKSFTYPNFWEIEAIPENSIPEPLLIELIGSRKDILFCEGIRGGLDEFIFNILFPNYTVTSVQSCFNVINYTKVFNITPNMQIKAIGFIDSDHHPDSRLSALTRESIYSFQVAEIENLLLDENFLSLLAEKILSDDTSLIQIIKEEAFKLFEKDIELQVANYISSKIDYYFKDSNMNKGNSLPEVKSNYNLFLNTIDIEKWYNDRKKELIEISSTRDYNKLLKVYNNKGLKSIAEKNFKISNFTDRALKLLQISNDAQSHIKKYFPSI